MMNNSHKQKEQADSKKNFSFNCNTDRLVKNPKVLYNTINKNSKALKNSLAKRKGSRDSSKIGGR